MSDFDLDSIAPERRDPSETKVTQQEKKVATKSSVPAAVPSALATPPAAPIAQAAEPQMPENVPQLNVPAPAAPVAANPITSEFLKTALTSVGVPALLGAGGAYLGNKMFGGQGQQPQPTTQAPAGLSELEQVKLDRERFKLEQDMRRAEREQTVFDQKASIAQSKAAPSSFAGGPVTPPQPQYPQGTQPQSPAIAGYGQTTINAPTGNPIVDSVAPANVTAETVKPVDPVVQAKLDAIAADVRRKDEAHIADQRRRDETHANRLTSNVKNAEASTQQKQGQPKLGIPPKDAEILANYEENKARAAVVDSGIPKPSTASPVGGTATPIANAATPPASTSNANFVAPDPEVAATAAAENENIAKAKRRTSEEVIAAKSQKPYISAKNTLLNHLGAKDSPEMDAKARSALNVLKENVFGGEKVAQTESHVNEHWKKAKSYILSNPEKFDPEIVARQKKSGEQLKSENSARKKIESQRGGINPDVFVEGTQKIAGAVKPIIGQAGALVGSELKGAAAMLPFMLATDVGAQNTGYRRELEQQLKTERTASRAKELEAEIKKLDEDKYINAMKRRYVDRNIPSQLRNK